MSTAETVTNSEQADRESALKALRLYNPPSWCAQFAFRACAYELQLPSIRRASYFVKGCRMGPRRDRMLNLVKHARGDMRVRPGIDLASMSDVGCQRENNEDRFSYWEPTDDEAFHRKGRLMIVADGMGGYEGGQEASRIAVETIQKTYATTADGEPRSLLLEGFRSAHQRIQEYADKHPEFHGMGTTCTAVVLLGHELYYAHIGDSRLYLGRDSKIYRLTRDQSYVGRLVEEGIISSEEAGAHPQRHILTSALGSGVEIAPESPEDPITLEDGDVLILCTDGLWGLVKEPEMQAAISGGTAKEACRKLVEMAKAEGGPDNITVQVARIQ